MQIAVLVLAAGASRRMRGLDKLLQDVDGRPLLARVLRRAVKTRAPVWVTLPGPDHPRAKVLPDGVTPVWVAEADEGMGASIRAGMAALPQGFDAVMILPADLPDLRARDLRDVMDAYDGTSILRATDDRGAPGHPVIFPSDLFDALRAVRGDDGARSVIGAHKDRLNWHVLPERRATTDLDTPEAWADWRATRKTR